jgi:beta-barrel assembly-enhancing protease
MNPTANTPITVRVHGAGHVARRRGRVSVVAIAILAAGCSGSVAVPPRAPVTDGSVVAAADPEVAEILRRADEVEHELRERGLVLDDDPELQAYLDSVGRRVLSAAGLPATAYRFGLMRDPFLNAFALPNGGVYVHIGLIARIESEAQLAHVLGHEIAHVSRGHSLASLRHLESTTVKAKLADVFVGVVAGPLIGLAHASAISGYSREQEAEADRESLRLGAAAGYSAEEAIRLFSLMDDREEVSGAAAYFSDHPASSDRVAAAREMLASGTLAADGVDGRETHRAATRSIVLRSIDLCLQRQLYSKGLREAELQIGRRGDEPWLLYYRAEAHRLIASDPEGAAREDALHSRLARPDAARVESFRSRKADDQAAAEKGFRKVLALDPTFAPAHRGLGLLARDRADHATVRAELSAYLRGTEPIPDRRSIERILEEVGS